MHSWYVIFTQIYVYTCIAYDAITLCCFSQQVTILELSGLKNAFIIVLVWAWSTCQSSWHCLSAVSFTEITYTCNRHMNMKYTQTLDYSVHENSHIHCSTLTSLHYWSNLLDLLIGHAFHKNTHSKSNWASTPLDALPTGSSTRRVKLYNLHVYIKQFM